MPEDVEVTIGGKKFPLAAQSMLPAGKRAWERRQRPSQPSDPGIPQLARWLISGPQGNSREDVTQGAGVLSVDWAEGMDTLYDALLLPGPKVTDIDLVSISQSEYVETTELAVTESDGTSASSDSAVGTIAWANPSNVLTDDTAVTTATGSGQTEYLKVLLGAATRLPVGATLQGFKMVFRRYATAGAAWTVIDSETLAAPASSISFTGIDTTYKMFRITAYIVKDGTDGLVQLRMNNDSGANYDAQRLRGDSTTVDAARATGDTSINCNRNGESGLSQTLEIVVAKQVAGSPAMVLWDQVMLDNAGTPAMNKFNIAGRWNNTADLISRIDLIASAGNFAAGTVVVLEGA